MLDFSELPILKYRLDVLENNYDNLVQELATLWEDSQLPLSHFEDILDEFELNNQRLVTKSLSEIRNQLFLLETKKKLQI